MATIENLANPRFTALTREEQVRLVLDIRAARRVTTPIPCRRSAPRENKLDKQIGKLTSDQALKLMELLNNAG
jgi:hypothetical protein